MSIGQTIHRWAGFVASVAAEAVCPLLILAIALDAGRTVVWKEYAGRDVQIYATIARYWQDGFIPYRDLYDFKPPLILMALRAGWALWGYDAESLRRVVLILTAASALLMYASLRRAGLLLAAPLAALGLVTLIVADPWRVVSQNTELLTVPFGAAAFGCAVAYGQAGRWQWAWGAGACVALAALGKQPAVLWALPAGVQLCLWALPGDAWRGNGWRRCRALVARMLLYAAGFGIVIGCVVGYFAWHDAGTALCEATIGDGMRYAALGSEPWPRIAMRPTVELLRQMTELDPMWPFVGAVVALIPLTILRPSRWVVVTWSWLLASYAVVVVGPRGEWHYLMCAFPALAIAVGMVVELAVGQGITDFGVPARRLLVGGVLLALLVYGGIWRVYYFAPPRSAAQHGLPATLGKRIREAAGPADTFFVKDEPFDLYLHAGMPPMTRIIYPDSPTRGALEVWASALEHHPTFIFISHGTEEHLPVATVGVDATLAKLLAAHYERWLIHPIGIVYRRK